MERLKKFEEGGSLLAFSISVKPVTDIVLSISFPENSWHEIEEIDVIFGEQICIVYNSNYRSGFGHRQEKTVIEVIPKGNDVNPCVMCSDITELLKQQITGNESPEEVIKLIKTVIEKYNFIMHIKKERF